MDKRAFILIYDMLAGHWDEDVTVPASGLPAPNVMGYVKRGLLSAFRDCIETGVFAYAWNRGTCNTPYGQKYLASGSYRTESAPGNDPYWDMLEGRDRPTVLTACAKEYPRGKYAGFGSDAWMQTGWWKARDCTMGWGSYFSDFLTMQYCFKWMLENPEWKMALLYLAQYDRTGNCPVYRKNAPYLEDKHHSLLQLDRFLWMVKTFLVERGWWEDTHLFIGSDHGCHYGCEIAVAEGRERGIPESELANYCSNHQVPHDCRIWDFGRNGPAERRSDCCRRTTFLINGGALEQKFRGLIVPSAEIIDFAPTIARFMAFDLPADGKSAVPWSP